MKGSREDEEPREGEANPPNAGSGKTKTSARETGAQLQGEKRRRQREVWGVVGRAGAPLSSSAALWRLSNKPSGT